MAGASRRALLEAVARLPVLRPAAQRAYKRRFERATGNVRIFRGVYPDFAAARRDAPPEQLGSFDSEASARRLLGEWLAVSPYDYPVLFWLERLLRTARSLFDWGGNVGLKYFAYRRYLTYAADFRWLVSDVPAVAQLGAELAEREKARGLAFTSGLEELGTSDILLAGGLLHFIEDPFAPLREAPRLPPHVLLSKVPAYGLSPAVTLQNAGTAIRPNHLFNRDAFVAAFEGLGYRLIDEWLSPDCSCDIPFFAEHSIAAYSGFYFTKES